MTEKRCGGCYDSFSGPWCDNCDQWPCVCDPGPADPGEMRAEVERASAGIGFS
jgi:hypothetical protein